MYVYVNVHVSLDVYVYFYVQLPVQYHLHVHVQLFCMCTYMWMWKCVCAVVIGYNKVIEPHLNPQNILIKGPMAKHPIQSEIKEKNCCISKTKFDSLCK